MSQLIKINDILRQEVSRKEFLRYLAIALLAIIGVTNVIKNLDAAFAKKDTKQLRSAGYGSSVYGR